MNFSQHVSCYCSSFLLSFFSFFLPDRAQRSQIAEQQSGRTRKFLLHNLHNNWSLVLSFSITLLTENRRQTIGKSLLYLPEAAFHRNDTIWFASTYSVTWGLIIKFLINSVKDSIFLCQDFCLLKFNAFLSVISYVFRSNTCKVKLSRVRRT